MKREVLKYYTKYYLPCYQHYVTALCDWTF